MPLYKQLQGHLAQTEGIPQAKDKSHEDIQEEESYQASPDNQEETNLKNKTKKVETIRSQHQSLEILRRMISKLNNIDKNNKREKMMWTRTPKTKTNLKT
jgi:hypothetical protein